ncbi:hypothetical protein FY550_09250 [Kushneria phosphatilytica]|uniref:Galactose oxidase n=1 Tax=Kushneria phosphatilytica TaxID=657387 RepID=A0A5C0ZZL7_9GAMM|nr:kelch repeat-containing protein [Kushneria phosphatilytica]QEL11304.1 hypothetical protein FY550_09250 [Kushneria phosphatilytica]
MLRLGDRKLADIRLGDQPVLIYQGSQLVWGPTGLMLFADGHQGGLLDFDKQNRMQLKRNGTGGNPATGDPVGWVKDRTLNGFTATAASDSERPAFNRLDSNRGYVIFDGSDDYLNVGDTGDMAFDHPCFVIALETSSDLNENKPYNWPLFQDRNAGSSAAYSIYETRPDNGEIYNTIDVNNGSSEVKWSNWMVTDWRESPDHGNVPSPRYGHHTASDGRYLYIHGGRNDDLNWFQTASALSDFYRFDPVFEDYETLPTENGPPPTSGGTMVYYEGALYLIGGTDARQSGAVDAYQTAWKFVINERQWYQMADPPFSLYWSTGCVVGDSLYVLGGYNSSAGHTATAYRLDFEDGSWHQISDIPYSANNPCSAVSEDHIYLCGGYNGSYLPYMYEGVVSNGDITWTQLPDAPAGFTTAGVACDPDLGDIYVFGGKQSGGLTSSLWIFYRDDESWEDRSDAPIEAVRFNTADMVKDRVVIFGGYNGSSGSQQCHQFQTNLNRIGVLPKRRVLTVDTVRGVARQTGALNRTLNTDAVDNDAQKPLTLASRQDGYEPWRGKIFALAIGNSLDSRKLYEYARSLEEELGLL